MIWGLQWDATCNWLETSQFDITNSSTWGNYYTNTADGHGSKQNTGFSENWKANNIYDFAGNCEEWTQEASDSGNRALRGGYLATVAMAMQLLFVSAAILSTPKAALVLALLYT